MEGARLVKERPHRRHRAGAELRHHTSHAIAAMTVAVALTGCVANTTPAAPPAISAAVSPTSSPVPTHTTATWHCEPKSRVAVALATLNRDLNNFEGTPGDATANPVVADAGALWLAVARLSSADSAAIGAAAIGALRTAAGLLPADLRAIRNDENQGNTPVFGTLIADAQNFATLVGSSLGCA
jgi:hypothetical protein